jgi:hypothetical protein
MNFLCGYYHSFLIDPAIEKCSTLPENIDVAE